MKNLKKSIITVMMLLLSLSYSFAQSPYLFNYQGVARDLNGQPIANQSIALKLAILATNDATASEYEETQTTTTNEFGLYTLQIGAGEKINGSMEMVKWDAGNKYIQVAIDPKGGTKYEVIGTTQLLSVPYAIYANKAGVSDKTLEGGDRLGTVVTEPATTGNLNMLPKFNGTANTLTNSRLFDNGNRFAIGTTTPLYQNVFQTPLGIGNTLQIKAEDANEFARLRFQADGPGAATSELTFSKLGSTATGLFMGMPRANMAAVNNNGLPGDYVVVTTRNFAMGTFVSGNAVERWRMIPNGNIGLGTTTPTQKLDVNGQIRIQGGAPALGKVLTSAADGTGTWEDPSITSAGGTNDFIPRYTPTGSTLGNSIIQQGNFAGFGGATGIGIGTAPLAGLHIKGIDNSFDAGLRLEEDAPGTTYSNILHGQEGLIVRTPDPTNDQIFTTSGSLFSPNLIIKSSGSVGVNTFSPSGQFGVTGFKPFTTLSSFSTDAGIVYNDVTVSSAIDKVGIYTNVTGSPLENIGAWLDVNGSSIANIGVLGRVSTDPGVGNTSEGLVAFDPINTANTRALRVDGKSVFNGVATMSDINATNTVTQNLQVTGGVPAEGKVLTSDAIGNATWKENQTGDNGEGATIAPSNTASFTMLHSSAIITITSSSQKIMWTTTVSLGSTAVGGGTNLRIQPAYFNTTTPATVVGITFGIWGLTCAQNTRQTYTISGYTTGLAPGTYQVGMAGSANGTAATWNNNEFANTTFLLME